MSTTSLGADIMWLGVISGHMLACVPRDAALASTGCVAETLAVGRCA